MATTAVSNAAARGSSVHRATITLCGYVALLYRGRRRRHLEQCFFAEGRDAVVGARGSLALEAGRERTCLLLLGCGDQFCALFSPLRAYWGQFCTFYYVYHPEPLRRCQDQFCIISGWSQYCTLRRYYLCPSVGGLDSFFVLLIPPPEGMPGSILDFFSASPRSCWGQFCTTAAAVVLPF